MSSCESASLGSITRLSSFYQDYRGKRYQLQNIASDVLYDNSRLSSCCKAIITTKNKIHSGVDVAMDDGKAFYRGVMTCNNIWICPICAARITLERKQELLSYDLSDYHTSLLTLTIQHGQGDDLKSLLSDITKMRNSLKSGRWWKENLPNLTGHITTTEVTYGSAGFHVHFHMLLVFNKKPNYDDLGEKITRRWISLGKKNGRYVSPEFGVDLSSCTSVDYITKWSIQNELIDGHKKEGKQGNMSIWQLVDRIGAGEDKYKKVFREYAKCFKGKKQLVWSRGLKDLLPKKIIESENDNSDSENDDPEEESTPKIIVTLTFEEWDLVCRNNARSALLSIAENEGILGICMLLDDLIEKEKSREKDGFY